MNVLNIVNNNYQTLGGIETYCQTIYLSFPDISFFEISLFNNDRKKIHKKIPNVNILEYKSNYPYFLYDEKNFPKCFYRRPINKFFNVVNKILNAKKFSKYLENIIKKHKIQWIIINSTYFYNKKFFNEYKDKIILVQHQIPYMYLGKYDLIKNEFKKINILKQIFNYIFPYRYPFIKYIKNFVVFDKYNRKIFEKNGKKINYFEISIPSLIFDKVKTQKIKKIYDFIIPIRVEEQKNIDKIIEFAYLNPNKKIIICGNGSLINKLFNIPNIKLVGQLNREELSKYLQKSKFLISFSFYEGFPISIVEAFALGIPCIVANTFPSAKYLIGDNERGFLFRLNDNEYNQNINSFIQSISYKVLSQNCKKFSKDKLNLLIFKKKWEGILNSGK